MAVKGTGTRGFLSGYFDGLQQTERKERYSAKLKDINGQDPYEIRKNEWLDDLDTWRSVTCIHTGMYMYLLFNASPYKQEQLMNYISLDCYQNFAIRWVREVFSKKFGENRLLIAKVRSENRLQSCLKVFTPSRGKCFGLFSHRSLFGYSKSNNVLFFLEKPFIKDVRKAPDSLGCM